MKSFEDFYKELILNDIWFEPASMHHTKETFEKAARKVYLEYVADEIFPPIQAARKHVANVIAKINPDKPKVDWTKKALEKLEVDKSKEWQPVTPEKRAEYLEKLQEIIKGSTMANSMPKPSYKQLAEEGGVLPPKPAPYPCTSKEEAYIKDRRFAYIKQAFEARTGDKLPGAMDEETFNALYDSKHLTDKGL